MYRESDHPRDNDGKFTDGNGESGKSRSEKMIEAVKKYSDSPEKDLGGDADAIWDKPIAGTDKSVQLGIINATNPAPDDYHTWIRKRTSRRPRKCISRRWTTVSRRATR